MHPILENLELLAVAKKSKQANKHKRQAGKQ